MENRTSTFQAAATPTEHSLVAIWSLVLGQDHISRNDTFLDAGGESILAFQCLNQMRETYGIEMSPTILFENSTIADLATMIDAATLACRTPQTTNVPTERLRTLPSSEPDVE